MRTLPTGEIFTRDDARTLGWSDAALTRALRSGRLLAVRRGQLTADPGVGPRARAVAAVQACRDSAISDRSALHMHRLPVLGRRLCRPELTVAPGRVGSLRGAHVYRATIWDDHVVLVEGHPVLSVARTLIDVGRHRPCATAVAAMDAALHRGLVGPDELAEVLRLCWNWPGIRRAQRAVRLADGRAESPLESVSRLVIRWQQLPAPDLQAIVLDRSGLHIARLDFYWDEFGVAGEADGKLKYTDQSAFPAEKVRQERAENLGLEFARWGWDDAVYRPRALAARIGAAFQRGRARDRSGMARGWSIVMTPAPWRSGAAR